MESIAFFSFDYLVFGIIFLSGFIAFFRGFVQETLSLFIWVIAFAVSMFFDVYSDPFFSEYIQNSEIRRILIIMIAFVSIIFLGGLLIKLIRGLVHWSGMSRSDRLLGVVFGFLRGIILIVVIYLVLPNQTKQLSFIVDSESYNYLEQYAPMAEKFFKSMISDKNSVMLRSNISAIQETT